MSSLPKQVTFKLLQSGPTCVSHQLAEEKEPAGGMADPPQPPWKFWLRVGSAAVGVAVGWLMFPVWSVLTSFFGFSVYPITPGVCCMAAQLQACGLSSPPCPQGSSSTSTFALKTPHSPTPFLPLVL